jgi:MYXO-CTERM domain-containing protein
MKRPEPRWVKGLLYSAALLAVTQPACGASCSLTGGIQPLPSPLPRETILENGIQVRITNQGFDFIEANLTEIIGGLLGNSICLPQDIDPGIPLVNNLCPSDPIDGPALTCEDGTPGCPLSLRVKEPLFTLDQAGNGNALLRAVLLLDLGNGAAEQVQGSCVLEPPIDEDCNGVQCDCAEGRINIDIDLNPFGAGSTCDVVVAARDLRVDATLSLSVNAQRQLAVAIDDVNLDDIVSDFEISVFEENRGDPDFFSQCGTADFGQSLIVGLFDLVAGLFEDQLVDLLGGFITDALPNPPGIEGIIDIGGLFSGLGLPIPIKGNLEMSLVAGGYAKTETSLNNLGGDPNQRGLSLGLRTGVNSDFTPANAADGRSTPNPCVRTLVPPLLGVPSQVVAGERFLERTGEFAQNVIPLTTTSYDIGLGVSEAFLDSFGFHAFNSGILCLNIGSDVLGADIFSSDTLAILLPSIRNLARTPDGTLPLALLLRPQNPLDFSIGEGGAGSPLLTLQFNQLELDIYTVVDDRPVRLFTASTSFGLGVDIATDPVAGTIIPTIDTNQLAGLEITITNSELLSEDPDSIGALIPTLLNVALPLLANIIGPIAPPNLFGFTLDLGATSFQRVQANLGQIGNPDFLGVFAGLNFDPFGAGAKRVEEIPAITKADLVRLDLPSDFTLTHKLSAEEWPGVALALDGSHPEGALEWQHRVDGGIWSPFSTKANPTIRDPRFLLQGEHKIEVRSRQVGKPGTLDNEITEIPVLIDTIAPELSLSLVDGGVRAAFKDVGTPRKKLVAEYRADASEWAALPADGNIPAEALEGSLTVEVRIRDAAGHETLRSLDRVQLAVSPLAAACSVSPAENDASNGALWFGLALLGAVVLVRRKGAIVTLALVGVVAFAQGCACGVQVCSFDSDCAAFPCDAGEAPFCDIGGTAQCQCGSVVIEAGDNGRFADIASQGDEAVVVSYNSTFGDLVLARVTPGPAGTIAQLDDFVFVDGVPEGPVVGDPNGVRNGIRDPGDDVGQDASVALDAQGNAHIAYLDVTNKNLKYARVDNTGQNITTITVDADPGFVGRYTDIVIGPDGSPQISYMAVDVAGSSQLRFVRSNNAQPQASGDWGTPLVIDSLAAVPPAAANLIDTPKGTGLFTSMALRADGRTRILYFDSINGLAKRAQSAAADDFASLPGSITALTAAGGQLGAHASLFVDAADGFHHAMIDNVNGSLVYFGTANQAGNNFIIETIDTGVKDEGGNPVTHEVGGDAQVFGSNINGNAQLFAVYHDSTSLDAVIARRAGVGLWNTSVLSGNEASFEGSKGFFTAAAVSGNNPNVAFVVNYVLDQQEETTALELITVDLSTLP